MKKTLALLSLLLVVALIVGCQAPTESADSEDEQTLADGLAEIESLEDDLNLDDLDAIDQELADLE